MNLKKISIKEIYIQNFKNIEYGYLDSFDLKKLKQDPFSKENHVLGIYGQNGSGKTAVIEGLAILKLVLSGEPIPESVFQGISTDKEIASFRFTFFIESKTMICFTSYSFQLDKNKRNVTQEKISVKTYSDQWEKVINLLEVGETDLFAPKKINRLIKKSSKESYFKMNLYKELANKLSCSYLFYQETYQIISSLYKDQLLGDILEYLTYFGKHSLLILQNLYVGLKQIPLIRTENEYRQLNLLDSNQVTKEEFQDITKSINQLNHVLKPIIPYMHLEIRKMESIDTIDFEILSIKEGHTIPLAQESSGIKKILSILHALLIMFNDPLVTLAIDELDSGIFEFLLGEVVRILEESNQGYLFFTSHNLRPLERLHKESIIFTTVNPKERFIRLHNVRSSSNLREQYFRNIILKEQKEELYLDGNPYEMKHYLKKAYYEQD